MKLSSLIKIMILGTSASLFSQGSVPTYQNAVGASSVEYSSLTGSANDISKIQSFASVTDFDNISFSKVGTEGSNYLFENWENVAKIVAGEKKYTINNINYNVRLNRFESQVEDKNSLFVYDLPSISSLVINGRQFKSLFNYKTNTNDIYEVIVSNDNLSLLKAYEVRVVEGSPNPMVNRKKNKIKKETSFHVERGNEVVKIKLNRKSLMNLLELDGDAKGKVEAFIKENKLSYKNEKDIKRIFAYAQDI